MRFTIKLKLALAFATVLLLLAITASMGIINLASLNRSMDNLLSGPVQRRGLANGLDKNMLQIIRAEKDIIL